MHSVQTTPDLGVTDLKLPDLISGYVDLTGWNFFLYLGDNRDSKIMGLKPPKLKVNM